MKKNRYVTALLFTVFCLINISCSNDDSDGNGTMEEVTTDLTPDTDLLSDFWFGSYEEDVITNPEDPTPGFIYLKIPASDKFEGELHFSFSGCESGVDLGRIEGDVTGTTLSGSWAGDVDNIPVGGNYSGSLVTNERYEGIYTNSGGKIKVECEDEFSYYVAPNGTWFLQKVDDNDELDIQITTINNQVSFTWNSSTNNDVIYNIVFVDASCLDSNLNIEECTMWSGVSITNSFIYGSGIVETVPAKRLIYGQTYISIITGIDIVTRKAISSSNIRFVAKINMASNGS